MLMGQSDAENSSAEELPLPNLILVYVKFTNQSNTRLVATKQIRFQSILPIYFLVSE